VIGGGGPPPVGLWIVILYRAGGAGYVDGAGCCWGGLGLKLSRCGRGAAICVVDPRIAPVRLITDGGVFLPVMRRRNRPRSTIIPG
jgi:hypothetical protein